MSNSPSESARPNKNRSADEASFRALFESTYPKLVAYARRRSFDRGSVDDVVSEVYATAWRRRADLDDRRDPLPWLYGIAANVLRNQWRADSRRLQLVDQLEAQPVAAAAPDPAAAADDGSAAIREALGRLTFDDQEVLRLVAWEGLSHAEVGEVLECSTNAVGIRIHRARLRLEEQLMTGPLQHAEPTDPTGPAAASTAPTRETDRPTGPTDSPTEPHDQPSDEQGGQPR
ncbi:MAG: RNA polymerase sigma factor [Actinomycetota bacterium]